MPWITLSEGRGWHKIKHKHTDRHCAKVNPAWGKDSPFDYFHFKIILKLHSERLDGRHKIPALDYLNPSLQEIGWQRLVAS